MRKKVESVSRRDRLWMSLMRIGRKASGCHQMPERSFFFGDYQFPLCARCTGILIGHVLGIIVSPFYKVPFWSLLGTLPLMADGSIQKFTSYESTNRRRLFTGILYGFAMMSTYIRGIVRILRRVHLTNQVEVLPELFHKASFLYYFSIFDIIVRWPWTKMKRGVEGCILKNTRTVD